jgi:oligopeptide/dipeptide ABC transporter ATP-binding protein
VGGWLQDAGIVERIALVIGTVIFAVLSEIALAFIGVPGVSEWNWGVILFWTQRQQALAQGAWWWFVPPRPAIALLGTVRMDLLTFSTARLRRFRWSEIPIVLQGAMNSLNRAGTTADPRPVRRTAGADRVLRPVREALHPYSDGLPHSFPALRGPRRARTGIPGSPPDPRAMPSGCAFIPPVPRRFRRAPNGRRSCHQRPTQTTGPWPARPRSVDKVRT